MVLNLMSIVVRLMNIPQPYKKPGIASKLCTKFATVVEVIPPKGEFIQTYLRVKVEVAS